MQEQLINFIKEYWTAYETAEVPIRHLFSDPDFESELKNIIDHAPLSRMNGTKSIEICFQKSHLSYEIVIYGELNQLIVFLTNHNRPKESNTSILLNLK